MIARLPYQHIVPLNMKNKVLPHALVTYWLGMLTIIKIKGNIYKENLSNIFILND